MVKDSYRGGADASGGATAPRRIKSVHFGMQSPHEMEQCAQIKVVAKNLYNQDASRSTIPYGVLDHRMGTSGKDANCQTCGKGLSDCIGHFGYIDLELPVFHVGYFRSIIQVLQCICKSCCRILLLPKVAKGFRQKVSRREIPYLAKKALRKKIIDACKKVNTCPSCGELNGVVKKCGLLKISHEKFRSCKKNSEVLQSKLAELEDAAEGNKELESMVHGGSGLIHILNPLEVLEMFERIPADDIPLLMMDSDAARPSYMILTRYVNELKFILYSLIQLNM